MAKKVTRTWINKSGQTVKKTYRYDSKKYTKTKSKDNKSVTKDNKPVTKEKYTFDKLVKSKDGKLEYERGTVKERTGTLVYKSGKINEKKIQEIEKAIKFEKGFTGVNEFRKELRKFKKYQYKTMRLTVASMLARMAATKIESTIRNFGYTPEELAVELGAKYNEEITVDYLLNDANWQGKFFITPSGNRVEFEFDYHGGVLADV